MSKGDQTKSSVLGIAVSLASRLGLAGVTIGRLADDVGMSKSGLFAHFASKQSLEVAILEEAIARFIAMVIAPALKKPRGEPRVRAMVENWLAWSKADFLPGGCIFIAAAVELDDRPGPARNRLVASQRDWLSALAGAAKIAVEEKHFRADLDTEQFAHELYSIAYGYHFLRRIDDPKKAEKRARIAFDRVLGDARARRSHRS